MYRRPLVIALITFFVLVSAVYGFAQQSNPNQCFPNLFTVDYYTRLANSYQRQGYSQEAINAYSCVIQAEPASPVAYYQRGKAYDMRGQYLLALQDFTQALRLNHNPLSVVYASRGLTYSKVGLYQFAITDLTRAIEDDRTYTIAYFNRGYVYTLIRDYPRALIDYTYVVALDFDDERAYNNRGFVYRLLGEAELAIGDHTRAILLNPEKPISYRERGLDYAAQGNAAAAFLDFMRYEIQLRLQEVVG